MLQGPTQETQIPVLIFKIKSCCDVDFKKQYDRLAMVIIWLFESLQYEDNYHLYLYSKYW